MKKASIFDIDGTLLESVEADGELYALAVEKVLGIDSINTHWSAYRHVTDQGILREILEVHGKEPRPELFEATRRQFLALLHGHVHAHGPFREIPGAVDYVNLLVASGQNYVAYATGAWRESAMLKLESAGFPIQGIPLSTSSEFEDRVSILRGALAEAPSTIEAITYYGDGEWDRAAVAEVGWEFVAVGEALGDCEDTAGLAFDLAEIHHLAF